MKRFGIEHCFIDYRDERQPPETLMTWKDAVGGWHALINKSSTTWRELPPNRKTPGSDAEWKLLPEAVKRFCAGKIRLHGGRAQLLE